MTTTRVWIQLYIGQEKCGDVELIYLRHDDNLIAGLRHAVKETCKPILDYCAASQLKVYEVGTSVPVSERTEAIDPGDGVPEDTCSKSPLIVVAPPAQSNNDDNILGSDDVYTRLTNAVCFFRDKDSSPIGAGFAISPTTVYSVAHNFLDPVPTVGTELICHFGKPNQQLIRRLKISRLDTRLDYCVLNIIQGELDLPGFLEVSSLPLKPGKNCILAAFQIGIQKDLEDLDPDLSVGVFKGEICKLYPHHFVYQCGSFAGDSGGAIILRDGKVIGIHQETIIQARERIQHGEDLDADERLASVEGSIDELLRSLSSGSIGLQLSAIT